MLGRVAPRAGGTRTIRLETATYKMVGVTWRGADPDLEARTRSAGHWTPWSRLGVLEDLPDPTTSEGVAGRRSTALLWVGPSDGIEVRVTGSGHSSLALVLLDPAELGSDAAEPELASRLPVSTRRSQDVTCLTPPTADSSAQDRVARPAMLYRKDWGADERLRNGKPTYNHVLKQVHVHHTVNANDYRREDVAAMIRGMYAYHTQSLGWDDIGYNFLVDRFGRAWKGRAGRAGRMVRGAHTLGFNDTSTGIAAIGNFETTSPTDAMLQTIAELAAWKLDKANVRPTGKVRVESTGSDRYRAGAVAELPVIDGHRDTNQTACPGRHLYAQLPQIRKLAQRYVEQCGA